MCRLLAVTTVMVLLSGTIVRAEDKTIPKEAFEGWRRLADVASNVKGKYEYQRTVTVMGEQKVSTREIVSFETSDRGALVSETSGGKTEILALNADYAFYIDRESADRPFELRHYWPAKEAEQLRMHIHDQFEPFLFAGFEIVGKKMPEMVGEKRFTLRSLVNDEKQRIATLEFSYAREEKDTAITGGVVRFLTNRDWAIDSYECPAFWGRSVGKVRYKAFEGSWIPEHYEQRSYGDKDGSEVVETYKLIEIGKLSDGKAKVALEDYGLNKPDSK